MLFLLTLANPWDFFPSKGYYLRQIMDNTTLLSGKLLNRFRQLIPLLLLFFFNQQAFAQAGSEVTQLLNARNERIDQSLDTREIDRQLYALGHLPKAVVTTETLENGHLRIQFPTYQPIPEAKKTRIEERLGVHYNAYLLSINVEPTLEKVTIVVPATTTAEQLDALFDHFGYQGHE